MAPPDAMGALVRALGPRRTPLLSGIAWFRLPTDEDGRAWRVATWRAVMAGRLTAPRPAPRAEPPPQPRPHHLRLIKHRERAIAHARIRVPPARCRVARRAP